MIGRSATAFPVLQCYMNNVLSIVQDDDALNFCNAVSESIKPSEFFRAGGLVMSAGTALPEHPSARLLT